MSTKLDLLITLVDNLDARSTQLLNSIQETNYLVTDIMSLNNDITAADKTIDFMDDLVSSNYTHLNEFESLYERSFLLESNMHLNDVVTSETTLDNLRQEYRFLMNRFTRSDGYNSINESPAQVSEEETTLSTHFQTPPRLHNSISVSNLKLKPIRCRSRKIPRKKASMRITSTSTAKLIENSDILLLIPDEDEITTPVANMGKRLSNRDFFNAPFPKKIALSNNEATITDTTQSPPSKIMDTFKDYGNDDSNTISTSPDLFGELHSRIKVRSNSLPETPKIEKFELNSFNILKSHSNTNSSNIFQACNDDSELLRLNRLKHFISSGNVQRHIHMNGCDTSLSKPSQNHKNKSIFDKTPTFTPVDIENNNIDQFDIESISVCSDFSDYSPEEPTEELDNFESFLRKSRIDLAESFPNIITKAKSHDSIFTNEESISSAESAPARLFKFHNPIDNMNLNSLKVATTTVEPIYYHGGDQITHSSKAINNINGNTTKLLNDVMSKTDRKETPSNRTPNRIKKSLFNFKISSPSRSVKSELLQTSNPRRGSLDLMGKSLTDSFMSLVNTGSLEKLKKCEPPSIPSHYKSKSINSIEQSSSAKERPIVIRNDTLIKRLPPRRKDGAHSNLIIGPNKTKIVNHGDQSVFRKPLMTKVSRNSLNEALSQSML